MSGYLARLAFGFTCKLPVVLQTEAAECGLSCLRPRFPRFSHRFAAAAGAL